MHLHSNKMMKSEGPVPPQAPTPPPPPPPPPPPQMMPMAQFYILVGSVCTLCNAVHQLCALHDCV